MTFLGRIALLLFFCVGAAVTARAQDKCGTVWYEKNRRQQNPKLESVDQFEHWMQGKIAGIKVKSFSTGKLASPTYTIPVVVHVIHNGESVGTGTNISDAQVQSQIDVLNKDYPRLNTDTTLTLAGFKPVAGSIDIKFVLAKQDPEGQPSNGILRVRGSKTGWLMADNNTLKAESYWPAEDYLNVWVVKFVDPSGVIGYAQLPVSALAGLENNSKDRLTDGVVIDYKAFGKDFPNMFPTFNKGRTATHEIGHFFGLRHIWGDDSGACSGTDYCTDTPNQGDNNNGQCFSTIHGDACSTSLMYQNYMDYTDDACMNLFSKDQVSRMVVVLGNSIRRASLLNSHGSLDPSVVANDLGIKRLASPVSAACTSIAPSLVVRNYGSNVTTSAQITLSVNGTLNQTNTVNFSTALNPLDSATVTFNPLNLSAGNSYTFAYAITSVNGGSDGKAFNNTLSSSITVPAQASLPFFEGFTTAPTNWSIINPDGLTSWAIANAANGSPSNKAIYLDYYNYQSQGETDQLISPSFDLTNETVAILKFDHAYTTASGSELDRLKVIISTGCGFSSTYTLFNKAGTTLATVAASGNPFVPSAASQWVSATIPLTAFLGQANVRISFVGINDWGNNLYIDNVQVINGTYDDLTLEGVSKPSPVTCLNSPTPEITVRNSGTQDISSFQVQTTIGTGGTSNQTVSGFTLHPGEEKDFTLSPWALQDGTNNVNINVNLPGDAQPTDNMIIYKVVVNTQKESVPIRENLDANYPEWTIVSQDQNMKWVSVSTIKNISLEYNAFSNLATGSNSWFVSPVLDFSDAPKASLFFDLSYAKGSSRGNERLQVLASTNCGYTFPISNFDKLGSLFSNSSTSSAWTPAQDNDWSRIYINLDTLVGQSLTRLAFVVTNDNGNNLYLDNIEIYKDDNPNPADIHALDLDHLVYYDNDRTDPRITFNLPEKETVNMKIFNAMGQLVSDIDLPDMLNQTYHFDLGGKPGIYFVRLLIGNHLTSSKVFIPN